MANPINHFLDLSLCSSASSSKSLAYFSNISAPDTLPAAFLSTSKLSSLSLIFFQNF